MSVKWYDGYDKSSYARGWRSSLYTQGGALDRADARDEVAEWYDGYLDCAAGRERWHLPKCRVAGGCAEHKF